jgi:hypothetical protein
MYTEQIKGFIMIVYLELLQRLDAFDDLAIAYDPVNQHL